MSRIGKKPITIPASVTVTLNGQTCVVKGPKGELAFTLPRLVSVVQENGILVFKRGSDSKPARSLHGTVRATINNFVHGVTEGFSKELELVGTGYRARLQGSKLVLSVGYSHEVEYPIPSGIEMKVEGTNLIQISGANRQSVGQVAAQIRAIRPPEPYKGKGIRYRQEVVRRKAGKAAKTGGAA